MKKSFVVIVFLSVLGCAKKPVIDSAAAGNKPDPLLVQTAAAQTRRIDRSISVTGSLIPDETVNVSFEVAGRVSAIQTDFGKTVHKGDVIAELDQREYSIQLERSKAALAQALARLGLIPGQEQTPPDSTPAMRQAMAQQDDAKFKYESAAKLVKTGDVSQERFTELEKAYRARQAAVEASRDDMRTNWANMQSLRADVKMAEKRLSDTVVRAPFDGAVTAKMISAGQYIKENTTVVTLVKSSPLRLHLDVPESAAGEIGVGTSVKFATSALPGQEFSATVREINPSLDAKSRSLTVEARISGADGRLRPGMFVEVQLVTARQADVVLVPRQAVYTIAGLTKVFVVRDGHASEQRVPPGLEVGDMIEVPASQVKAGDRVAVSNLSALVDGAEVRGGA